MSVLLYTSVILEGLLASKLLLTGLFRAFRVFTIYAILVFARDLLTLRFAPKNTHLYESVWAWSGVVLVLLQACVVFELYGRVRSQIPDLGVWGRRFLFLICGFALIAALTTTWIDLGRPLSKSPVQAVYTLTQRNLGMALAIVAVLSSALFYPFRVRLRRNTVLHSALLALYLGSNTVIFGAINLEMISRRTAGFAILTTAVACYGAWLVGLRSDGEGIPRQLPPLSADERADLARQERELLEMEQLTLGAEEPGATHKP